MATHFEHDLPSLPTPPPQPKTHATLRDVAKRAGVSIKTASRVVNLDSAVSDGTRKRVTDAIAAVNYVPNGAARMLRAGTSATIGLVVDSIADPWFAGLTAVVEEHALAHGMTVVIGSSGRDPRRMREHILRLVQLRCRGLIIAPTGSELAYLPTMLHGVPLVCVDRPLAGSDYDSVHAADFEATFAGVDHLIKHGHTQIALIGYRADLATLKLRHDGYVAALNKNGIAADPEIIFETSDEIDTAREATLALLKQRPDVTAIFASNPRGGLGVTEALHSAGRTDLAVVSFGDFPLAGAVSPGITVLDQDPRPIATNAATILFKRLAGMATERIEVSIPLPLIARGSGEICA